MTSAQGLFGFCGGVLAPATGMIVAYFWRVEKAGLVKGFVLGSLSVFCALAACSFIAILCYPGYPKQPVSEFIAMAFTLPVIGASVATIWIAGRAGSAPRRLLISTTVVFAGVYASGAFLSYQACTWSYRKALPWTAVDIREDVWEDSFLPDYSYAMRARISAGQFADYVSEFKLKSAGIDSYEPLNGLPWWNPSGSFETFRREEGDWFMSAFYDGTYLYVSASEH